MIVTVTLNPCFDHTVYLPQLAIGGTNRALSTRRDVSGKGINVSIALKQLGLETHSVAFAPGEAANPTLEPFLVQNDIPYELVATSGHVRTNIKLFDESQGVMTECNEWGTAITVGDVERMSAAIEQALEKATLLILSGSAPPNTPEDFYRKMILLAQKKGVCTVLDASGAPLRQGVLAKPTLIKPNQEELETLVGYVIENRAQAIQAMREAGGYGIAYVCLSMGREGAMLAAPSGIYFAPNADIQVKGVQGAGDSMVAGICLAMAQGKTDGDMLRYAVAAAHGSLLREGTLLCRQEDFAQMLPRITAEKVAETNNGL